MWGFRTTVHVGAHYEKDVTGNAATSYYTVGGQRIAQRRAGVVYYLHTDHLGSASLTTDASGNRVGELRYKPYGETRYIWGVTPTDRRLHRSAGGGGAGPVRLRRTLLRPAAGAVHLRGYGGAGAGESAEPQQVCVCDGEPAQVH